MTKKFKKILVSLVASAMCVTGSMGAISASAAEFHNFYAAAGISGQFNALNDIQYKSTNNYVYIHLTSATNGAYVQTWGLDGQSWSSGGSNLTYDVATHSLVNSKQLVIGDNNVGNWINESNKYYCGLKFGSGAYYYDSYLTGYWTAN